jgi:hypothetical protein
VKRKLIIYMLALFLISPVGLAQAQLIGGDNCEDLTYSGVTPDTFACMKQGLENYGINVPPGRSGELSGRGVTAEFMWDGESRLTVEITEKPFFVDCDTSNRRINNYVEACKGPS